MANWWDSYVTDPYPGVNTDINSFGSTQPSFQDASQSWGAAPSTNWWDAVPSYDPNNSLLSSKPDLSFLYSPQYPDSAQQNWWNGAPNTNLGYSPTTSGTGGTGVDWMAALNKFLGTQGNNNGQGITLGSLLGSLGPAALGAYASNNQTDQLTALADKYSAMGAPYRQKLSNLYADPSTFLNSDQVRIPVQQGTDMLARSLSTQGNPIGSGNALTQLQKYSTNQLYDRLGQEKDRLAGFGGLSAYSGAAPQTASNAINSNANMYNAIGAGVADLFTPKQNSLADLIKAMGGK